MCFILQYIYYLLYITVLYCILYYTNIIYSTILYIIYYIILLYYVLYAVYMMYTQYIIYIVYLPIYTIYNANTSYIVLGYKTSISISIMVCIISPCLQYTLTFDLLKVILKKHYSARYDFNTK